MKLIEAMKKVKRNREKIADLHAKISAASAHLSHETPQYEDPKAKVASWVQSCTDLSKECVQLLTAISRTNLETKVTIDLGGKPVEKTIAEWIWRRREFARLDIGTYQKLTDRKLREGTIQSSTGVDMQVTIVRNYDPEERDKMLEMFSDEPSMIDSSLEVANAITDLIES